MRHTSFCNTRVNRLREKAVKARVIPHNDSDWSYDGSVSFAHDYANKLLAVFDSLWLKEGFALYAYVYRAGGNGNGRIWVVPTDALPEMSRDGLTLEDDWVRRPPGAVPLMRAIEGDGSPWSYLSASILSREAAEFGAMWHGCEWTDQTILSKPPRQSDGHDAWDDDWIKTGDAPLGNWTWHGPVPRTWEPTLVETETTTKVVLHIYNPIGGENIYRASDTYPHGSYDAETQSTVLCSGDRFIVY